MMSSHGIMADSENMDDNDDDQWKAVNGLLYPHSDKAVVII